MTRRSPARWLAPAALAAAAIAVYVVVSGGEEAADTAAPPAAETTTSTTGRSTTGRSRTTPTERTETRSYTVQPGDTLSTIAAENDTTIEALQEANPDAESAALTVGETLRLPAPESE